MHGVPDRPRVSVFRSLSHIYAQLVDDEAGGTIAASSSLSKELAGEISKAKGRLEIGTIVGRDLARLAREKGVSKVVFDRNGFSYHGRVKALAEGARAGGLEF